MENKDIEHCRLLALGAAQIAYDLNKGEYSPDTKERTYIIAENLYLYYLDALDQLSGRNLVPQDSWHNIGKSYVRGLYANMDVNSCLHISKHVGYRTCRHIAFGKFVQKLFFGNFYLDYFNVIHCFPLVKHPHAGCM